MVDCICKEISARANEIQGSVDTIYFGGGTPSLLSGEDISKFMKTIQKEYTLIENPEITLEANPDDLTEENLVSMHTHGINRLSIGVQSFDDHILHQLNRVHNSLEALYAIKTAKKLGFNNISIDLIFGLPDLSNELWQETLEQVVKLDIQHISCYNLTIEERTALWHFVNRNKVTLPPIRDQEHQFYFSHEVLCNSGFDHYEISNYAKEGFESKHNSNYWNRSEYLGFGPSAHSFIKDTRKWNISNNFKYMKAIDNRMYSWGQETLSAIDQFNEFIMLGLRTKRGLEKSKLLSNTVINETFEITLNQLLEDDVLVDTGEFIKLYDDQYYLSDYYSAELFIDN